jgi:hypothetical protein
VDAGAIYKEKKNEIGDEFHYLFSCFILITKNNSALKNILETNPIF